MGGSTELAGLRMESLLAVEFGIEVLVLFLALLLFWVASFQSHTVVSGTEFWDKYLQKLPPPPEDNSLPRQSAGPVKGAVFLGMSHVPLGGG